MSDSALGVRGPTVNSAPFPPLYSARPYRAPLLDGLMILATAAGGFVLFEPAPYELIFSAFFALLLVSDIRIRGQIAGYILFAMGIVVSGLLAAYQTTSLFDGYFYIVVSAFLYMTGIAIAFYVANDPLHAIRVIMIGYTIAATYTAVLAVGGYFGVIPGGDIFLLYDRAKGAFEDPNVMGPFLVPALVYLASSIVKDGPFRHIFKSAIAFLILLAILLSFSRGAWGHTILSVGIFFGLTFLTASDLKDRLHIVIMALIGLLAGVLALSWALTLDVVADLFQERARLTQSYDTESGGRFDRYLPAIGAIISSPLGHGPGEFARFYGEDPHNTFIKMFYAFGWLAGISYLTLILTTLVVGFWHAFERTPWQRYFHVFYAAFAGLCLLSLIIDTDRWRHFHLLTGLLWGMMAANRFMYGPAQHRHSS